MIDRNHPAVEALADAIYWALSGQYGDFGTPSKGEAHAALTAALPHLTADNLRDTPGGRALMAEGWDRGWRDRKQYDQDIDWRTIPVTDTNPYRDGDA